jgi:hypothetical protein
MTPSDAYVFGNESMAAIVIVVFVVVPLCGI